MPADDHLRGLFKDLGPDAEPTAEQRDAARRELYAAMRSEPAAAMPWWRQTAVGWSAAVALVAAIVAFVLVVPTSTPAVDANLADVAAAARTVEPMDLPDGSYIYYRVESITFANETVSGRMVSYLIPATEDLWVSGTSEQRQRTVEAPIFTSVADEEAFYASGLAESEGVGETRTESLDGIPNEESVTGLPTDASELLDQIVQELSVDPDFAGDEARILQHVAQLMSPRLNASPELRGALLEVLGRLDVTTSRTAEGGVIVRQAYVDDFGAYEQMLEFDEGGFLIRESLSLVEAFGPETMAPVVLQDIRYTHPSVVSEPGVFPTP